MHALLCALKGNGVKILLLGCGFLMATKMNLVRQLGALDSVFFSFLPRDTLKTDCLELGFKMGKALCLLRCLVRLQLSLKNHICLFLHTQSYP